MKVSKKDRYCAHRENIILLSNPVNLQEAFEYTAYEVREYEKSFNQIIKGNGILQATKTFLIIRYDNRKKILIKSMSNESFYDEKKYLVALVNEFALALSRRMHEKLLELSQDYDVFCVCYQHAEQHKRKIDTYALDATISDSEGEDEFETTCLDDIPNIDQEVSVVYHL